MPAGAAVNLAMNSVSIRKHSARLRSSGVLIVRRISASRVAMRSISSDCSDEEIGLVDFVRPGAADRVGDELHVALEELRVAVDLHVVAVLERAVVVLAGVPQPGGDRAAAVGKLQLQIEVAVAVGAQLLIGGQKHLAHLFVVAKLADESSIGRGGHGGEVERSRGRESRARRSRRELRSPTASATTRNSRAAGNDVTTGRDIAATSAILCTRAIA